LKAYIYNRYGPPEVLNQVNIEKPLPKSDEVLIKVKAVSVSSGDVRLRSSNFPRLYWLLARLIFGLLRPKRKILGHEFSGVVQKVGEKVYEFKEGDEVFGTTTMLKAGAYAQYVCIPQTWKYGVMAIKPSNLGHDESAALPIGAMTALFLLEKANISSAQRILIYGASGSVGTYAVQLSSHYNVEVTAVCSSANLQMVRELGANKLIDYLLDDFKKVADRFDIVFDAVGKINKSSAQKILKPKGSFVSVKMMTKETRNHLLKIKELSEKKEIKPVLDKVYQFNELVEAHKYVDQGHKKGNVVVLVD